MKSVAFYLETGQEKVPLFSRPHFIFTQLPPYSLTPKTQGLGTAKLDVSGMESMGTAGGVTFASRVQRRVVTIGYNIQECNWFDKSLIQLIDDGCRFFQNTSDINLTANKFTMIVTTDDKNQSAFLMRHGAISVPFDPSLADVGTVSLDNTLGMIFDDPNRYWIGGAGVVTGTLYPGHIQSSDRGELWTSHVSGENYGQAWNIYKSMWISPVSPTPAGAVTLNVVSAKTVTCSFVMTGDISDPVLSNTTNGTYWKWDKEIPEAKSITCDSDGNAYDWDGQPITNALGMLTAEPGQNVFTFTTSAYSGLNPNVVITIQGAF